MAEIDIEKLAREAGATTDWGDQVRCDPELNHTDFVFTADELCAFAALVLEEAAKAARDDGIAGISADDDEIVANYLCTIAEGLKK